MIEGVRLGVRLPGGTLWEDLDLLIGDGEFRFVTGPPSSGKTVLSAVLRGDRRPDSGELLADGKAVYRAPAETREYRARVGSIPEAPGAAGRMTVGRLFDLATLSSGAIPAKDRRLREEELLAMVGLPGAGGRDTASLSTSERARIALAAELFRGPRYLFADRLLENAGAEWADRIVALFRALAKEGTTVMAFERTISGRWAPGGDAPADCGPFRVIRVVAGTETPL